MSPKVVSDFGRTSGGPKPDFGHTVNRSFTLAGWPHVGAPSLLTAVTPAWLTSTKPAFCILLTVRLTTSKGRDRGRLS